MNQPVYRVAHVGINTQGEEEAYALADLLCRTFCLERGKDMPTSIFVGDILEVMKHSRRGVHGHIALQTDDVEAAMADLASRGITFQEDTIRRDDQGRVRFIYLRQQFGGFEIHLTAG